MGLTLLCCLGVRSLQVYPQGKMSQYIDNMKVGELIDVKGPKGLFTYTPNMKRAFGMLAGGTGITYALVLSLSLSCSLSRHCDRTCADDVLLFFFYVCVPSHRPMLQVIQAILKNPADKTQVSLIFANVAEDDILVRSTLEDLEAKNPDRFKLHYTLDKVGRALSSLSSSSSSLIVVTWTRPHSLPRTGSTARASSRPTWWPSTARPPPTTS
jgi:predicted ferric reductase